MWFFCCSLKTGKWDSLVCCFVILLFSYLVVLLFCCLVECKDCGCKQPNNQTTKQLNNKTTRQQNNQTTISSEFIIQASALHGVRTHLAISHCEMFRVNSVAFQCFGTFQCAVEHYIAVA